MQKISTNLEQKSILIKKIIEKTQNLKMKTLLHEKNKKYKNYYCIRFITMRIFSDRKSNLVTYDSRWGLHVIKQENF